MPSREKLKQRRRIAEERAKVEHNSLFGEILDWMLAPLMFVWPISIAIIHSVADDIAHEPYDKVLGDSVYELSRQVRFTPVGAIFVKPPSWRSTSTDKATADSAEKDAQAARTLVTMGATK